jgi:hypothetical protein
MHSQAASMLTPQLFESLRQTLQQQQTLYVEFATKWITALMGMLIYSQAASALTLQFQSHSILESQCSVINTCMGMLKYCRGGSMLTVQLPDLSSEP